MRCVSRSGLSARLVLLLAILPVSVLTLLLAAPVVTWPGAAGPADCAAAEGAVRAKLVIDFGILSAEQGAPSAVTSTCTSVGQGASGLQVIEAAGHAYRLNNSGLVCAIDGYPSGAECGDRTPDGYRYWAYFSGGAKWTYSGIGPSGRSVGEGAVEGWHFVQGKGNPTDPPPNAAPQSCAPTPTTAPPTVAPTTARPGPPPAPTPAAPSSNPAGPNPRGGPGPTSAGGNVTSTAVAGASPTTAANGSGAAATDPGAPAPSSTPDGGTTASTDPEVPLADGVGDAVGADTSRAPGTAAAATDREEIDVATAPTAARSSSTGAPIAAILGGLAVLALGGFAVFRMRTRPEDA